jgi:hypothetical protein
LLIDEENEIASKILIRKAIYLTVDEKEAICRDQISRYIDQNLKCVEKIDESLDNSEDEEERDNEKVIGV